MRTARKVLAGLAIAVSLSAVAGPALADDCQTPELKTRHGVSSYDGGDSSDGQLNVI